MFLHKISRQTPPHVARPLALSAALLTFSALCLAGCGGPKTAADGDGVVKEPEGTTAPAGGAAAGATNQPSGKEQAIIKEAADEKHPDSKGP